MAAEVRCTIAWTLSPERVEPAAVSTNTEAVVSGAVDTKTVFSGMASRTAAVFTPSMAEMVLASSPSSARLYVTDCWNSEDVTPILSSRE